MHHQMRQKIEERINRIGGALTVIAIYGPRIYTAPYVMFLMRANPLQGPLEGLGPETARAKQELFGPKKVETFMAQPFRWPRVMSLPRIKIIKARII